MQFKYRQLEHIIVLERMERKYILIKLYGSIWRYVWSASLKMLKLSTEKELSNPKGTSGRNGAIQVLFKVPAVSQIEMFFFIIF